MKVIPVNENAPVSGQASEASKITISKQNHTGNSTEAQRARVLEWLKRVGSATTIELRRDADVMMPGTRIYELRHQFGYQIDTIWCKQATECGRLHRVARYVYRGREGGTV